MDYKDDNIWLMQGDCLERMKEIPDGSVDMVFADLPYGTTYAKWDQRLPMDLLWEEYGRVCKDNAAMVFTATQPFAALMISSKLGWFRCEWIWDKVNPTNFANANRQPLKQHESVLVFGKKATKYNPQKVPGKKNHKQGKSAVNTSETRLINKRVDDDLSGLKFPKTIQTFPKHSSQCRFHPTEKLVDFIEYWVKTYSDEGDVVLDNTFGSGSTCVAARNLNRKFIGIELDENYFNIAKDRILENESNRN